MEITLTFGKVTILVRPKDIWPEGMLKPKGIDFDKVVAIVGKVNYQVAARLWVQEGYELVTRVVIDTGSAISIIRQELLPEGTEVAAITAPKLEAYDLNGGLISIVGTAVIHVCLGAYHAEVTFAVVPNMTVPVILGTDYTDVHVSNIYCTRACIRLLNGEVIPILHRKRILPPTQIKEREEPVEPEGATRPVCLAKPVVLPPRSRGYVLVNTKFQGNGFVSPLERVYERHQIHVAPGPMTCKQDQCWLLEVINTARYPRRCPAGMKMATVESHRGTVIAVTTKQWQELGENPSESPPPKESGLTPHISRENVPENLHSKLDALISKHHALWEGKLGLIKATEHRIQLKPGVKPVRLNPYRMGTPSRQIVREEINKMKEMGVIEPSSGEWASPIVLVPKPDGSTRFCIDYRKLNERTVKDSYPLPRMDDCLDSLGNALFFSTLDCNAGYWQIPIREEDRCLTAFTCHCGTYQCTRLPFGLCNAPATFQRAIDMILTGVKWQYALVYLDDIIVFSKAADDHLRHLDQVFTLLGEAGVTLKASKCHLFSNEVEYLGHVVRPGRISVNEKNLKAIKKARFPETQTQLRSFLGMCNVYRRFTKNYAKISGPLHHLASTKLPKRLEPPTEAERKAFDTLRDILCNPPILALPREDGHYILDVDASYDQLGCCLLQQQATGEYLPVGYFSKALSPSQKNYTVTELEGLGVVWAVSSLRPYIEGTRFLIRCDHKALKWILTTTTCTNNRLNRWRILLSEFDYDVEYKPGVKHAVADALSRLPTDGTDDKPIPEDLPCVAITTRSGAVLDPRRPENHGNDPIPRDELVRAQAEDSLCKKIRSELDKIGSTRFYENGDGILCRRGPHAGEQQIVVPKVLRPEILKREHHSPLAGHPGSSKMYQTMRRRYYWPSLAASVYGCVAACETCIKNRLTETQCTSVMRLFPATEPFSALAVDLLGPLTRTPEGYEYLLVICDRFTKLTRAVPLKTTTAMDVVSSIIDVWVASYGIPDSILSDNGPQFASILYQGVMSMLGVTINYATPYHPQTNGQVERFNKTLVRQLRHYVSEHVITWARYVSLLVTAYNSQVHSSTGEAPFSFVCPRRLIPAAVARLTAGDGNDTTTQTPGQAKACLLHKLEEMIPLVRDTMDKAQARYKRNFDVRVKGRRQSLRIGDWVLVNSHDNEGGKLVFKAKGPYQILKTDGRRLTIESDDGIRTINGNHAIRAPDPPEGDPVWARALAAWQVPTLPSSKDDKPLEAVFDKFVGYGYDDNGRLKLKVRWYGYGPRSDTWENVETLPREKVRKFCRDMGITPRRRQDETPVE